MIQTPLERAAGSGVSFASTVAVFPAEMPVTAEEVRHGLTSDRVLVVLDDDPTGTQSVSGLPVLTRWDTEDFAWAFAVGGGAVYVLTNSRSLAPAAAAERNRQVVQNALAAAGHRMLSFVSRSDSTLRGHFPLEPDTIADVLEENGQHTDAIIVVPAFPDAGRVTIGGTHYLFDGNDGLTPVGDTEFSTDATFGFSQSHLPDYVEEKSEGRLKAADVIVLDLDVVRAGPEAIADRLHMAENRTIVVADAVVESDLRVLSLGLALAESRGKTLLYRVGPPFVRARIGQEEHAPLMPAEIYADTLAPSRHGLIIVGSHVGQTTAQLDLLLAEGLTDAIELDVAALLDSSRRDDEIRSATEAAVAALEFREVVVHTSRLLIRTPSADENLVIARSVSAALVAVVQGVLRMLTPRYVVAKGGITSSDVAAHGLGITRAIVLGPLLPGIISVWRPMEGPANGIPFVVFAGNVGGTDALTHVVDVLRSHSTPLARI